MWKWAEACKEKIHLNKHLKIMRLANTPSTKNTQI